MANKDLRKMKRIELLDIISALQENEEKLKAQVADLEKQLNDRTIELENTGSIAEAALSLNKVFEAAQAAADQYLESIHSANKEAEERAKKIISGAKKVASLIISNAEENSESFDEIDYIA